MSAAGWALAVVLALVTVGYVLWPWVSARRQAVGVSPDADALRAAYSDVLDVIRALDDDLALGKLAPTEHAVARADQVARGIALLKALEAQAPVPDDVPAPDALDAHIEAAVAAKRQRHTAGTPS